MLWSAVPVAAAFHINTRNKHAQRESVGARLLFASYHDNGTSCAYMQPDLCLISVCLCIVCQETSPASSLCVSRSQRLETANCCSSLLAGVC